MKYDIYRKFNILSKFAIYYNYEKNKIVTLKIFQKLVTEISIANFLNA